MKKQLVLGILAHVDAGKTTLTESILYLSKTIRRKGRVDHQDAFLDYESQERNRGITIFSKQARFNWKETRFTLIDTPGHVDFASEMERSLQVLDAAILVISGVDGVQSHTETIWKLLRYYQIPTFVYVNKMDISHRSQEELMKNIHQLDDFILDFNQESSLLYEQIAMSQDEYLDKYLQNEFDEEAISQAITCCHIFPCFFGSALKEENVDQLFDSIDYFMRPKKYPDQFGAKVFKITYDENKNRLTHLKVTGGHLGVKEMIQDEKIDQIRLYSGNKYELVQIAEKGEICTLTGITHLQAHDVLGYERITNEPVLSSYMKYVMNLPKECDSIVMMRNLKILMEEDPQLEIELNQETNEIIFHLMGEIQIEILRQMIQDRFNLEVSFSQGKVIYKETILQESEGIGHFEPLRHYAEVHVRIEPLELGSGVVVESKCTEDILSLNDQKAILSSLREKKHKGILSGSELTDVKITLVNGKTHLKHTDSLDLKEASLRAVRQGIRKVESVLLEPYSTYKLMVPVKMLSRAIFDIELKKGTYEIKEQNEKYVVLVGNAPMNEMNGYDRDVINYTKGEGKLILIPAGYQKCHNQEEVLQELNYQAETDLENPCDSIFFKNGSGFRVPWDHVEEYAHIKKSARRNGYQDYRPRKVSDEEVMNVYNRTYGAVETRLSQRKDELRKTEIREDVKKQCLLVDGYNILHAWDSLKQIAKSDLNAARDRLIDLMSSYQGYKNCLLILVFDAYKVPSNIGSVTYNGSIYIVYTKSAQTADSYIEATTHELVKAYRVSVATSDALEQLIVSGQGAIRISAREFEREVLYTEQKNIQEYQSRQSKVGHRKLEILREMMEEES